MIAGPGGDGVGTDNQGGTRRSSQLRPRRSRSLLPEPGDGAAQDHAVLSLNSGYRSYADQLAIFRSMNAYLGAHTAEYVAAPGHSEHQLGTAVDFGGDHDWLATNGWRFGFVPSYPADRSPEWTCYNPEPWHFRYFGRERAAQIAATHLSPREWLWRART